jgi:hypothetical protein
MAATTKQRLDKHGERLDKHDRQIAAIRTLMQEGVRYMVETRKYLRATAVMQNRTEAKLQALIDSLRRGGNGHSKKRVDLA